MATRALPVADASLRWICWAVRLVRPVLWLTNAGSALQLGGLLVPFDANLFTAHSSEVYARAERTTWPARERGVSKRQRLK